MDILNGDGFYGHYIFYRLLPIDLHEFSHYYHFKVLNPFYPRKVQCRKWSNGSRKRKLTHSGRVANTNLWTESSLV